MHTKVMFTRRMLSVLWIMTALGYGEICAQTYFDSTIPADPAPSDFITLGMPFPTPTGSGPNRKTITRILTPTPTAGVMFEITPPAGKSPAQVVVDGATGFVEVSGTGEAVADLVRAEVISDPPDNVPVASGFALIRVTIEYNAAFDFGPMGESWNLKAQEMTISRRYMGFIATGIDDPGTATNDIDALVTRPKIFIEESALSFGEVQEGIASTVAPVLAVTVRNFGTGPLTITGAPISANPDGVFAQAVFAGIPTLDPGGKIENIFDEDASDGVTEKKGLWIMAQPKALGQSVATLTVESASDTVERALRVHGVSLYAHMLMDVSDSMNWKPDGSFTTDETERRLTRAKEAGKELNNWIKEFSDGKAYLGVSAFPSPFSTENQDVVVPIDRSINTHPSIGVAFGPENVGGLKGRNSTPMADGFHAAVNDMEARLTGPAPPDNSDKPNLRQAILLLSDGAANVTAATPPTTPQAWIDPLQQKKIRTYTIGYGQPGASSVDWNLLQEIATSTSAQFFDANTNDAFALKNAFKSAVREWLGLRPVADPTGTIRAGMRKNHPVCLDDAAHGATFVVDWDRHIGGGITFTLRTPKGQTITSTSTGVSFFAGDTYAMYVIRGSRMRGGQGAGEWIMQLTGGNGLPATEDTKYSYSVLTQSPIDAAPKFPGRLVFTAQNHLLAVQVAGLDATAPGDTKLTVQYDIPAESWQTYIATGKVDPSLIIAPADSPGTPGGSAPTATSARLQERPRVPNIIMGEPATLVQKKAFALQHIVDSPFQDKRTQGTVQLLDDGTHGDQIAGDGIYSNAAPELRFDGTYKYFVQIEALTPSRSCVHRESMVHVYVPVGLTAKSIIDKVEWKAAEATPFFDPELAGIIGERPPQGFVRQNVVFTPQDRFGNYWGPGKAEQVAFAFENAKPLGPVVDNLDGSYIQVIQYKQGAIPSVTISAGGVTAADITMGVEERLARPSFPLALQLASIILLALILVMVLMVILMLRRRRQSA